MTAERADESQPSLYLDMEMISAVRKGDVDRLNRLLAKLSAQKPRKDAAKPNSKNNSDTP